MSTPGKYKPGKLRTPKQSFNNEVTEENAMPSFPERVIATHSPERDTAKPKMRVADFNLRIYEEAQATDKSIEHQILQMGCEFGTDVARSTTAVHGEEEAEKSALAICASHGDDNIKKLKSEVEKEHKIFHKKMFEKEVLLQMQEARKREAEEETKIRDAETERKEKEAKRLLDEGLKVQQDTLEAKRTVEAFQAYKDYVQRSVPLWGKEANSVDAVCGRFRDLLTLRFELVTRVEDAFAELQRAREKNKQSMKDEKVAEGQGLLRVYQHRALVWLSNRESEEAEAQLRTLRNNSSEIATSLTRVRLALANMYSVARRFQCALPPLQTHTDSKVILQRLHHFTLDASQVVRLSLQEEEADSLKPDKGSALTCK